jgi:hypothetical protein
MMRQKKLKSGTIFLLGLIMTGMQAQETIPASGGNASGSGGSVSFSIGQVVYTTHSGTNGSIVQGVQQPYEISVATSIGKAKGINLECVAYPNPTTDILLLRVESDNLNDLNYQLYDMNGKLLENKKVNSNKTSIDMGNLVPATYFLKVIQGYKELKTFKINKN